MLAASSIATAHGVSVNSFEQYPDAVFVADAHGVIRSANACASETFGYPQEELVGSPVDKLIPERLRNRHAMLQKNFETPPRTRSMGTEPDLIGLRKDGTEFAVDIMLTPAQTAHENDVLLVIRDMSKQYAIQEEIRRSDQQFRSVVECISDFSIYVLNSDGCVRTWNSGGERIMGYTEGQAVGLHFSHFFTQEDKSYDKPTHLLLQAAAHGRVTDEGWRVRKDGSLFWAHSVLTAIRGGDGQISGYAKVTRNATEQKLAAEAAVTELSDALRANTEVLRATELRYRTVFHTSPDAVTISRMSDGVIVDVNQAFLDATGYVREEVIGRTSTRLRLWSKDRDCLKLLIGLRRSSGCRDLEFLFRKRVKRSSGFAYQHLSWRLMAFRVCCLSPAIFLKVN